MGYARALRYACPIALSLGLLGCSENTGKRLWSRDEIIDIADDSFDDNGGDTTALKSRLDELESENERLQSQVTELENFRDEIAEKHNAVNQREADHYKEYLSHTHNR